MMLASVVVVVVVTAWSTASPRQQSAVRGGAVTMGPRSEPGEDHVRGVVKPLCYVKNVPFAATEVEVAAALAGAFGSVSHLKLEPGPVGCLHSGRGRVTFESSSAAERACTTGELSLMGRGMSIHAKNPRQRQKARSRDRILRELGATTSQADVERCVLELGALRTCKECTAIIVAWSRIGRYERAYETLTEARRSGAFRPNLINYNAALSALEKAGCWQRAEALLDEMVDSGLQPDKISWHTAIAACRRLSNPTQADALGSARCAVRLLAHMMRHPASLRPSAIAFTNGMVACTRGGMWSASLALFERLRDSSPDDIDLHSANAALAACAGKRDPSRARSILRYMREVCEIQPDLISYDAAVEAAASSGEIDEGFLLLDDVYEAGLTAASYPLHRNLLLACRVAGELQRADALQQTIDQLRIRSIDPLVKVRRRHGHAPQMFRNGGLPEDQGKAARALCLRLRRHGTYTPQTRALPFAMLRNSTHRMQVNSLQHHAEKKALAHLLLANSEELEMDVNIRVCVDCHAFLKSASSLLRRPIIVNEPTMSHVFRDGRCSCGDGWRWEMRQEQGFVAGLGARGPRRAR